MHHMGILSNRSIFGPLFSLKLNSCTYYVQYNTNPIGLLHCAIRDHNDYVILLFSKHSQELTLSHLTRSVTGATNAVTVTHVTLTCEMLLHVKVLYLCVVEPVWFIELWLVCPRGPLSALQKVRLKLNNCQSSKMCSSVRPAVALLWLLHCNV